MLLEYVVGTTAAADVAAASGSAQVVGDGVVEVALLGGAPAGTEPAGAVARGDQVGDSRRWPVGVGREVVSASASPLVALDALVGVVDGLGGGSECAVRDGGQRGPVRG